VSEDTCLERWTGRRVVVVTLPGHIDASNAGQITGQLPPADGDRSA